MSTDARAVNVAADVNGFIFFDRYRRDAEASFTEAGTAVTVRPTTFADASATPVGLGVVGGDVGSALILVRDADVAGNDASGDETRVLPVITYASVNRVGRLRARLSDAVTRGRGTWRVVTRVAFQAARDSYWRAEAALVWLTEGAACDVRRRRYAGRHRLTLTGFHRAARGDYGKRDAHGGREGDVGAPESDLAFRDGDEFVNCVAAALEATRSLHAARHFDPGYEFTCR